MKNRATKFISLALCAVVLFAAVGTPVFALTGDGKESEDENQETTHKCFGGGRNIQGRNRLCAGRCGWHCAKDHRQ